MLDTFCLLLQEYLVCLFVCEIKARKIFYRRWDMNCAEIILGQLGGNRFVAMTGAKEFVYDRTSLRFKLPRNGSKATHCKITLTPADYYRMEFIKHTSSRYYSKTGKYIEPKWEILKIYDRIGAEQLQDVFTKFTGLYTYI